MAVCGPASVSHSETYESESALGRSPASNRSPVQKRPKPDLSSDASSPQLPSHRITQNSNSKRELKPSFSRSIGNFFKKELKEDEAIAENFDDESFKVVKINKRQKEQERTLRLVAKGIENIRPNGKVSSCEPWTDVDMVYKVDITTIAIKYHKGGRDRIYRASSEQDAQKIVKCIRTRIRAHQAAQREQLLERMMKGKTNEKDLVKPELYMAPSLRTPEEEKSEDELLIRGELEKILLKKDTEIFKLKEKICNNFVPNKVEKLKDLRKYLDTFKYKIFEDYGKTWFDLIPKNEDKSWMIMNVIESLVESTCLSVHVKDIMSILNEDTKGMNKPTDIKIRLLYEKPQEFFGVPMACRSKNDWSAAVAALVTFPRAVLPSAKMQVLLATARCIHDEAKGSLKREITGDDLLPIAIYVLVKASQKLNTIVISPAEERYVDTLFNPEAQQAQSGYYFCVFSAALQFIRNYDPQKIEERFKTISRLKAFGFF